MIHFVCDCCGTTYVARIVGKRITYELNGSSQFNDLESGDQPCGECQREIDDAKTKKLAELKSKRKASV